MAEVFATGIQMGESPRWHDGRFWMCDWMTGEVLVFDVDGNRDIVARVEGMPFSIDLGWEIGCVELTPEVSCGAARAKLWPQYDRRPPRQLH
jgi:sugar lactone lactonase YvrE